jgi:hypothetical protein
VEEEKRPSLLGNSAVNTFCSNESTCNDGGTLESGIFYAVLAKVNMDQQQQSCHSFTHLLIREDVT